MNTEILWNNFLDKMKQQVSSLAFETWFKDTRLLKLENNNATIVVPLNLHKKHLQENYENIIATSFNDLTGTNFNLIYMTEDEAINIETKPSQDLEQMTLGIPKMSCYDANLNPDYNFENYMVGKSNKFAFTAALSVAEKPGKAYNPLFLYGNSGLGKTHLMHAIGNYILTNSNQKVLYVTSDTFVSDFIATVTNREKNSFELIDSFKKKYRNVDVLLIDDIQFLEGAIQSQQEFFHTFNELYTSNKQIIIASDRSVDDLKKLEDRLRTRFSWGLTANLFPPDFDLRISIIKNKILYHESADDVPDTVIEYIANNFNSDVRQLEGAITRVFAYALMMNGGKLDLNVATTALKEQLTSVVVCKSEVEKLQQIVSDYFRVNIDDLKGKKRLKTITIPRQIAIYYVRNITGESFPRIGTYFGGRDHTTIMHSYEKIRKAAVSDEQIKFILNDINKIIEEKKE